MKTPLPLTPTIARFVADPGFEQVPEDVTPTLRDAFIDTVACLLGGRDEPVVAALLRGLGETDGTSSRLLLGDRFGSEGDAAFINATAGHALDYDDMALAGHPSVVLVPALLAAAGTRGASGPELLRAYLIGYEAWAELARREPDAWHEKGWHPTGVIGTVAAAAAVAALGRFDATTAAHAVGIAASLAGGLVGNFGSMTKPLHAGWAARHGVEAARLARCGITAAADALEGPTGLLAALSPNGRVLRGPGEPLGRELALRSAGLSIKKYPVCYAAHRIIDGALALREQHRFAAEQISSVVATLSDVNARVLRHHEPATALQAKFSLEFCCAMALLEGAVGVRQLGGAQLERPELKALMALVKAETVPAGCPIEPTFALHDRVRITLADGRVLDSGDIRFARGHVRAPLRPGELREKFLGCVRAGEEAAAGKLLGALERVARDAGPFDPALTEGAP